jgi:hypothetical protein
MLTSINSLSDIETFINHLVLEENLNFHPDEDFRNYILMDTGLPSYTEEEAVLRNSLLEQCFAICEIHGIEIF